MPTFLAALLFFLGTIVAAGAGPSAEPVTVLPTFEVKGHVPLRKEASFAMHEPRYGAAVVAVGDYLYVIGGSNDHGTRLDTIERVDLHTGQSTPWAKLQLARRHHRAVVVGNAIYVLGGTSMLAQNDAAMLDSGGHNLADELPEYSNDDDDIFDAARKFTASGRDQYMTESEEKWSGSAAAPGGEPTPINYETSMEVVNLATGHSRFGPPMPVGKALFGCVALDGKIYVIGGQRKRGDSVYATNTTQVFDPATNQWSDGVNMPTARRCTAVVVDNFAVVVGGRNGDQRVARIEVMNPREKVWRRLPDLAERCNPSSVAWLGSLLFLFGDQTTKSRQLVYDLRAKELVPYPMPFPDGDFAAAVAHDGKIYVVGGADIHGKTVNSAVQVFALNVETPPAAAPAK